VRAATGTKAITFPVSAAAGAREIAETAATHGGVAAATATLSFQSGFSFLLPRPAAPSSTSLRPRLPLHRAVLGAARSLAMRP
jgi:hypothetical protein